MKWIVAPALTLALVACGDSAPPKPVAQPATPPPQAAAPKIQPIEKEAKAPEAPKPDPNQELARRVKQALERDAKVLAAEIDVTAKDGRVSLWGTAATAEERARAAQIAEKVSGVASVDNQLKIVKGS